MVPKSKHVMKLVLIGENGSVHIQKWILGISESKDIDVHVISFERGLRFPGVTYHFIKPLTKTKLDFFLRVFRVRRIIKKINPDLVHAHYATSYGFWGAWSGFHPFIITGWGADIFDSPANPLMRLILKYSFSKADAITVLSEVTRTELKKLSSKAVKLVPFGVPTDRYTSGLEKKQDEFIRIGSIRTLSEKYGVEYLIRAFSQIHIDFPLARLEIVGDGPQRIMLKNLCEELKIHHKVTFHGYVNQHSEPEKYMQLLQSFDVFAILSILDSETFGVAAVEAAACSIPVVATRVGGLPEVVEDGITGLLVPPADIEKTADALISLIKSEELRSKMGSNGRNKVLIQYDWKNNLKSMIDLYRSLSKHHLLNDV
jgi:glycosyltransferase involved in cell wall biosynthesis